MPQGCTLLAVEAHEDLDEKEKVSIPLQLFPNVPSNTIRMSVGVVDLKEAPTRVALYNNSASHGDQLNPSQDPLRDLIGP